MSEGLPPGLHIVATPIGNLGDLTPRAAAVLAGADLILAEDTRVTAKLLRHIGAKVPMRRFDDHSSEDERAQILAMLDGQAVALVSDAGTPLISDPGFKLVRAARDRGLAIHTLPGPSAVIAALTLAGLPTDRFLFLGFLPAKPIARAGTLDQFGSIEATLIFYESGPRLGSCLAAMLQALGPRDAAVVREISKLHEETVTGTLADLAERYANETPKGEIVIVVGPPAVAEAASDEEIDRLLAEALATQSPSRAAADVAQRLNMPRKRVYARALALAK